MTKPTRDPMFKQRHFNDEIILHWVRWYVTYKLTYRATAAMVNRPQVLLERGVSVAPCRSFLAAIGSAAMYAIPRQYSSEAEALTCASGKSLIDSRSVFQRPWPNSDGARSIIAS